MSLRHPPRRAALVCLSSGNPGFRGPLHAGPVSNLERGGTPRLPPGGIQSLFSAIAEALARDESVVIPGFGTFTTRTRNARQGRNPQTGESIAIAASKAPAFKAGKSLRDAVRAGPGP